MRDNYKIIVKFAVRIIPEETAARSLVRQMELGVNIHLFRVDGYLLLVVIDADEVAGWSEGRPGDVEPAGAGEELVGQGVGLQERDQALELGGILGTDVGGLAEQVLGVLHTAHLSVDAGVAEA